MSTTDDTQATHPAPEVRENAVRAFNALGEYLTGDGWYPQRNDEKHVYRMMFEGKNGELRCYAQIRVDLEQFVFYAVTTVKVPENARAAVAEFLTRANYGMRIGNFEMDYSDGEVRYKSSLDFEGETLSPNLLKNAIYPAVQVMDRYVPGLMGVAFGGKSPKLAVAEIEG